MKTFSNFRQSGVPFQDAEKDEEIMGIKHLALIFQKPDELVNMTEEEDPNRE
jgi:hypothetical protein